jgi:asparagine synthase (glutamine-hydrolysing)
MCGIAGIVAPAGFDPSVLVAMTQLIRYRGPDGYGFAYLGVEKAAAEVIHNEERWPRTSAPVVGLGNRRLAILDTSRAGNQPMQTADGNLCITYNGEVYNYREIREELADVGHRFHTGTDTEVILAAYQQWGTECLHRFNGMWAFALWDHARRTLFCARDRFGVKPFYYALHGGSFYFGSEIKQVLQASSLPRRANPQAVFDLLERGLADHSRDSFFDSVHQLPGGHCLLLRLSDALSPVVQRYWELSICPEPPRMTPEEATEEFRHRFSNAVKIRLRSDVPVGVCLSGGLDSSAILCQAKQIAPNTQFQTFSACFDDREIDEREYMAAAATATGSVTHPVFPTAKEFWDNIDLMLLHHDEPLGAARTFSQWRLMSIAREHGVPVVLGGQGADEAFCGYQKYRYLYFWQLFRNANPGLLREIVMSWRFGTTSPGKLAAATRYLPSRLRRPFSPAARLCNTEFRNNFNHQSAGNGVAVTVAQRQKLDLTHSTIPAFLRHEDRNSMAHSVETRHPFLDYRLVEFGVNCPSDFKLRDGWSKWILRNSMKGVLPEKVRLRRTKLGFDAPDAAWVRLGLQNGHRELWDTPHLRMERFLDSASLARECSKFLQGSPSALPPNSLFPAISLELWARALDVS